MNKKIKLRDHGNQTIQISDAISLPTESTRTITPEGYLKATAAVTMVGVQMYPARDFGIDSDEPIGVFRPSDVVFHPETASSLKMKPIVLLHPEVDVDATNHGRLSIGSVGETVEPLDSERLGASIQITDKPIVDAVVAGEVEELSLGYDVLVISEEGTYNGQNYFYRMTGPMTNNHLAIVPAGRCGDTVKILDNGGDEVNKKQMIKALRDAGVSEAKIALFMKDAKDTDAGDVKAFASLIQNVGDIDMSAIVPQLVEELKPALEEMVAGEEFKTMLAKEIAASMTGGTAAGTAGTAGAGDGSGDVIDPEKKEVTPEMMDAAIKDATGKRVKLISKASPFLKSNKDFDMFKATEHEILVESLKAVGVKDAEMEGKSDDYLLGMLDTVDADRQDATTFRTADTSGNAMSAPMTAIQARSALKKK